MLGTRGEHSVDEIMYIYPDFLEASSVCVKDI